MSQVTNPFDKSPILAVYYGPWQEDTAAPPDAKAAGVCADD